MNTHFAFFRTAAVAMASVFCLSLAARASVISSVSLDPNSVNGDYFGTIAITFNASDLWNGTNWDFTSANVGANFHIPNSSNTVNINLGLLSEVPGELYLYGGEGLNSDYVIGGGPGGSFYPGVSTNSGYSEMSGQTVTQIAPGDRLTIDAGFFLPMDWNGSAANWNGTWSLSWNYSDPASSVGEVTNCLALLGLALGAMAVGRRLVFS